MNITWYGNASIRIDADQLSLLFDPFVSLPGAPYTQSAQDFLPASAVFLTHGHFDHAGSTPELVKCGVDHVFATATPCRALVQRGVPAQVLHLVEPGESVVFNTKNGGEVSRVQFEPEAACIATDRLVVTVKRGKHIRFDRHLILSTIFNSRMIMHLRNLGTMLRDNLVFKESGETVVYEIVHAGQRVVLLGSLGLAAGERYTQGADLLVLPYQGNSKVAEIALDVIKQLSPQAVMVDHFDDAFPPISQNIDLTLLAVVSEYLDIGSKIISPTRNDTYNLSKLLEKSKTATLQQIGQPSPEVIEILRQATSR